MMTCSRIFYALSRLPRLKEHHRGGTDHQVKHRRFAQPFWSYTSLQLPALPFQFHHGFRILTQLVPRISINSRFTLHHAACRFPQPSCNLSLLDSHYCMPIDHTSPLKIYC
ncbi:hypothetical protein M758_2G230100 [Ceratodon purpureus]|nr:hypothetical protein M758_2G230100 [Ceratodon purpureus]